jgi:hypothetical protein
MSSTVLTSAGVSSLTRIVRECDVRVCRSDVVHKCLLDVRRTREWRQSDPYSVQTACPLCASRSRPASVNVVRMSLLFVSCKSRRREYHPRFCHLLVSSPIVFRQCIFSEGVDHQGVFVRNCGQRVRHQRLWSSSVSSATESSSGIVSTTSVAACHLRACRPSQCSP